MANRRLLVWTLASFHVAGLTIGFVLPAYASGGLSDVLPEFGTIPGLLGYAYLWMLSFLATRWVLTEDVLETESAPIDEPVTTDTNRLIRLPGSLHGGTGLAVTRVDRDALDSFRPLADAVPEQFVGQEIRIDVPDLDDLPGTGAERGEIELGGDSFTITEGAQIVPEYVGVYLMARGHAEKEKE
jgi:DNA primase small subunit